MSDTNWADAVYELRLINEFDLPSQQLAAILAAAKAIYSAVIISPLNPGYVTRSLSFFVSVQLGEEQRQDQRNAEILFPHSRRFLSGKLFYLHPFYFRYCC